MYKECFGNTRGVSGRHSQNVLSSRQIISSTKESLDKKAIKISSVVSTRKEPKMYVEFSLVSGSFQRWNPPLSYNPGKAHKRIPLSIGNLFSGQEQ